MKNESFDLSAASREALSFAVRQGDTLRQKLAPIAAHIFEGDDVAAMTSRLETLFKVCRGESLAAKSAGRREAVKQIGKAWNRLADGLRYHAANQDLSLTFPNLASGEGTLRVESKPDASARRKVEKEAREQADAEALALFQADQQQAQLDTLRSLTPVQLAESIAAQLRAWSDVIGNQATVVGLVAVQLGVSDMLGITTADLTEA